MSGETQETTDLMEMMIEHAKVQREAIPYSGTFHPMAFIYGAKQTTIMIIESWHNNNEKRKAVGLAMFKAREDKARCMALVTDARGLKPEAFQKHFTVRMAAYKCGPNNNVEWIEQTLHEVMKDKESEIVHTSDLLVDWWS